MSNSTRFPRELPAEYLPHAQRATKALGGLYEAGKGFIHWATGPFWADKLRTKADEMERQALSMRVIATFLEENQ